MKTKEMKRPGWLCPTLTHQRGGPHGWGRTPPLRLRLHRHRRPNYRKQTRRYHRHCNRTCSSTWATRRAPHGSWRKEYGNQSFREKRKDQEELSSWTLSNSTTRDGPSSPTRDRKGRAVQVAAKHPHNNNQRQRDPGDPEEETNTTSSINNSSHTCPGRPWLEGRHRQPPANGTLAGRQHTKPHHSKRNHNRNRGEAMSCRHRGHGAMQLPQHHPTDPGDRDMPRSMTPTRTHGTKTRKTIHLYLQDQPTLATRHGNGERQGDSPNPKHNMSTGTANRDEECRYKGGTFKTNSLATQVVSPWQGAPHRSRLSLGSNSKP